MTDTLREMVKQDARYTEDILESESVDLAITSPPYADLKDYGPEDQIGYGQEHDEYLSDLRTVFEGVYESLNQNGSFWVVVDTFKRNKDVKLLPFEISQILKDIGFKLRDIIIWDKNRTLPWTKEGEMRNVFEYILVFSKTEEMKYEIDRIKDVEDLKDYWVKYPERYNPKGKTPTNIWRFDIPTQGAWGDDSVRHACPFPPGLIERIIRLTTDQGDTVFDPFAGTGTVVALAEHMKREGIGFELNEEYIRDYREKIKPGIKEEVERGDESKLSEKKKSFSENIYKLRQLKFPKTVVRRLVNDKGWREEELNLNSLFAIPLEGQPDNKHKFMFEKVVIVHENGINEDKLEEDIRYVVSKPPASKFGIEPEIEVIERSNVDGEIEDLFNGELSVYTKGRFNEFETTMDYQTWKTASRRDKWKENFRNGVPPILSPIKININQDNL